MTQASRTMIAVVVVLCICAVGAGLGYFFYTMLKSGKEGYCSCGSRGCGHANVRDDSVLYSRLPERGWDNNGGMPYDDCDYEYAEYI